MRIHPEQQRAYQTLDSIRTAARSLIGQFGTDGFSMTTLAQEAGMSKPALYRYFPNKKAILIDLVQSVFQENQALLLEHLARVKPGEEVKAFVETLKSYCAAHTNEPYRRHLRAAMSADPDLVELDLADSEKNAGFAVPVFKHLFPNLDENELFRRMFILMNQMEPFAKLVASRPSSEHEKLIYSFAAFCFGGFTA